jgi:hypothetical protein
MRYELHADGYIFPDIELEPLYRMAITMESEYYIYAFYESKIHLLEQEDQIIETVVRRVSEQKKPTVIFPLLPYNEIKKAAYWRSQKFTKQSIHQRLYCSMALLTKSLLWYDQTNSQLEYESYNAFKKDTPAIKNILPD